MVVTIVPILIEYDRIPKGQLEPKYVQSRKRPKHGIATETGRTFMISRREKVHGGSSLVKSIIN